MEEEIMTPRDENIIIDMKGIYKRFYIGQPNELEILRGIDLRVKKGEFLSIVGASGSGKSTLMNIIGALDRATEGDYVLDGVQMRDVPDSQLSSIRNRKIGFVFQTFNLIPRTSALSNVELPMLYAGMSGGERARRAKELLELVEMGDRMKHMPSELSGGQKQRVAIARAVLKKAEILIFDDATSALDLKTEADLYVALQEACPQCTKILIAQRIASVRRADRIIVLENGKILAVGTHDALLESCAVYRDIYDSQIGGEEGEDA